MTDPFQQAWMAGDHDARPPAAASLHRRARQVARRAWLRDAGEYAAALVVVIVFALYWRGAASLLIAAGCALTIAGTLAVVAGLWRRRVRAVPDPAAAGASYLRAELAQQRDMLADVARWYLAPLTPGALVFVAGKWQAIAEVAPGRATAAALATLALTGAVAGGVWLLNHRAARRLDAEIAALDRLTNHD